MKESKNSEGCTMKRKSLSINWKPVRLFLLCFAALFLCGNSATTQTNSGAADRDGQHDFDFALGKWKIHLKKLQQPLTGSTTWVEFDGTLSARKVWNGRANMEEIEVNSPTGPIEGLTLRLYNPQSHQWSIYWANSKNGSLDPTPQIGQFRNGRGEFYGQDKLNGKFIYVRFVWTNTTSNSPHFEQSFSDDGGKTWEVNWITDQTRVGDNLPEDR
jgi:hypothetical protein